MTCQNCPKCKDCPMCKKMMEKIPTPDKKMRISIFAGLLFLVIASPMLFKVMRNLLGNWVASASGCPTNSGLILHTVVFILLTRLSMDY